MEHFEQSIGRIEYLSTDEKTNLTSMFCQSVEEAGYTAMIYGNKNWLQNDINLDDLSDYEIWFAAYRDQPNLGQNFYMWQYSSTATLEGISTSVDMNIRVVRSY